MYARFPLLAAAVLAAPCAVYSATPQTASSDTAAEVKWHPGHYLFVQFSELREEHIHKVFRGIQKTYSWRALEPEKDRYEFSTIRSDLAFLGKHGKRLVVQVQAKTFAAGQNYCPAYLSGPEFGGGVYRTRWGSFNPIIWNEAVNRRLNALYARLGKELDKEPLLEAVVIPESATTFDPTQRDALRYTSEKYARSVEDGMQAMKDAFPTTVVIQYVNMPPEVVKPLADYAKAHGIGFGGPDVYPYDPVLNHPQRGAYRLYSPMSGIVPLGAAVQWNDYTQTASFRGAPGETPVKDIYEFGRDKLKLNYMFWGNRPGYIEKVRAMLESPSFPQAPAGGLNAAGRGPGATAAETTKTTTKRPSEEKKSRQSLDFGDLPGNLPLVPAISGKTDSIFQILRHLLRLASWPAGVLRSLALGHPSCRSYPSARGGVAPCPE